MADDRFATHSTAETLQLLEEMAGGPLTFARLLRSHRECEGWSQAELARRAGVSLAYVKAVEGGAAVDSVQAARFAELFGMSPARWAQMSLQG